MRIHTYTLAIVILSSAFFAAGCNQPAEQASVTNQTPVVNQTAQTSTTETTVTATSTEPVITTTTSETLPIPADQAAIAQQVCDQANGSLVYIPFSDKSGKWGACYFKDNSLCEIESLKQSECRAGACHEVCLHTGTYAEGWYDYCTGWLIRSAKCAGQKK